MIFPMVTCTNPAITRAYGRIAQILGLVLCLAACQPPPGAPVDAAPFVLTSSGAQVLSDAPPGFEVTLGSKRLRPAGDPPDPE
jgi:hypothetical protein